MTDVGTTRFFDRHTHVSLYASLRGSPDLSRLDREGALGLLRALPEGAITTVLGWRRSEQRFTPAELARLPPALLVDYSLHGLALTPAAAEGLRARDPELVERHADPRWSEENLPRLLSLYATSAGLSSDKLEAFMLALEALGIDRAEDMLLSGPEALQVMTASRFAGRLRLWAAPELFAALAPEAQARVEGLKLFLDGALGARTAALSEPFRGGARGLLMYSEAKLREVLHGLRGAGKPIAIHAIGDLAIAQALEVLSEVERGEGLPPCLRLEHVQFITEAQARRARDLGLVLSMQPNFSAESRSYADRLGPRAIASNNPFRMLIDRAGFRPGRDLLFGSDGMPHGIECAAQWGLFPPEPGQRLTLEELLAGYGAHRDDRGPARLALSVGARRVELVRG